MVQSENSNPHISKNTNIIAIKSCVDNILVINEHLAHNSYTNWKAKKWADFGFVLCN